jgi:hypothetical protein
MARRAFIFTKLKEQHNVVGQSSAESWARQAFYKSDGAPQKMLLRKIDYHLSIASTLNSPDYVELFWDYSMQQTTSLLAD